MPANLTLRLTQTALPGGRHRVQLDLTGDGAPQSAFADFPFALTDQDREDLRWYLEDYLQYPIDPAPAIARRVEQRMRALGAELFTHLFDGNPATMRLWARLEPKLPGTRVEVASEVDADVALPWELTCDPHTGSAVAVRAQSFVRVQRQTARPATLLQVEAGEAIRVLLVICRPGGRQDVPFRSVASHLVRLSTQARELFLLEVLRPPTFANLARVLRQAASRGRPYHVVHFDGHGTWTDLAAAQQLPDRARAGWNPLLFAAQDERPGPHGYLLFEHPTVGNNEEFVDGPRLGDLLAETGVGVLVLNACQSAHADLAPEPADASDAIDVQSRVRAYGSLAQEVVDSGAAGVVAMRYSVYVVTAAQFIAELYSSLLDGLPLGEAASVGRKHLAAQPEREIAFKPRPLQDWIVPVVYEAAPVGLIAGPQAGERPSITLDLAQAAWEVAGLEDGLPAAPDAGFFGRDETLLALDRAFDTQQVVLLHAFAGAGKTSTATEFARWYLHTGGISQGGLVLFASFEQHFTLGRMLDQLGTRTQRTLEAAGIHWLALDDSERRRVALQILARVPVLWIWDNVEPVAGFPEGAESAWTHQEQQDLAGFLRATRGTKAKVLVTSRRDERAWLGELPARVALPPMPMAERVQLARAIAEKRGLRLAEAPDWRPLLAYTQGNPLTVTVLVGQALRENISTTNEIEDFVARLQAGEAQLEDGEDTALGRTRSLAASLGYGFAQAFSVTERVRLAVLHLFRETVSADALRAMGDRDAVDEDVVPEVAGLDFDAGIALLDRAADIGLLASLGGGYYQIHPALPWYFTALFTATYGQAGDLAADRAARSYAKAIGVLGDIYLNEAQSGREERVLPRLRAEEANLLHALDLARARGLWDASVGCLLGLSVLYGRTGRDGEWARLVAAVTPDFTDPATGGPLPGREHNWGIVGGFQVHVAEAARDWLTAVTLREALVAFHRNQAAEALAAPAASLTPDQRNQIRNLGVNLNELATLLREQDDPGCLPHYQEALALAERMGSRPYEADWATNMGTAYASVRGLRDLDQAERWLRYSLSLRPDSDRRGRADCLSSLGGVALERFEDAQAAGEAESALLEHLNAALRSYQQSLNLTPADDHQARGVLEHQLGNLFRGARHAGQALHHYQRSLQHHEARGAIYTAGQTRYNIALLLAGGARYSDALRYARAAMDNFRQAGPDAASDAAKAQQLITALNQRIH